MPWVISFYPRQQGSCPDGLVVRVEHVVGEEPSRLVAPELLVMPAQAQELVVRAALHDAPLIEYDQPVHPRDGREPVRNGNDGLAFHEIQELLLDGELDLAVER